MAQMTLHKVTSLGLLWAVLQTCHSQTSTPQSTTTLGSTVQGTDPDALCPAPDIADSVDWSHDVGPFDVGRSLILKCKNGNDTLFGPSTIKCIDPGTWDWDEGTIRCQYVTCEDRAAPNNGSVHISEHPILPKSTAQFSCDEGFNLVGASTISCMLSGQWTAHDPVCLEECASIPVEAGMFNPRCTYNDCNAWITCEEGYFVTGKNKYVCSEGLWVADDSPECTAITCPQPQQIEGGTFHTEPLPSSDHEYLYHTVVHYSCLDDSAALIGPDNLTCTDTGEWSGDPPVCQDDQNLTTILPDLDTSDESGSKSEITTERSLSRCASLETVPYATYSVNNRMVTYTCSPGYVLHGDQRRICLGNGSWTGESPTCIPIRMDETQWKHIFQENKEWKGSYLYRDMQIGFKFWFLGSTEMSIQTLLLDDLNAKLDLKGIHLGDAIIFETTRLLSPSEILHDTMWRVRGELTNDTEGWKFSGTVRSTEKGYSTLYMRPVKLVEYEPPPIASHQDYTSATSLALGIAIAIMAIIVAALLAAYFVKRKGGFKGTGHRTLTSFENPVYEYENNVSVKVI